MVYGGVRYKSFSNEESMESYFELPNEDVHENEFFIITIDGEEDKRLYKFKSGSFNEVERVIFGISPINDEQKCLLNLLEDDDIIGKCAVGVVGSGKTYCSLSWAIRKIVARDFRYRNLYIANLNESNSSKELAKLSNVSENIIEQLLKKERVSSYNLFMSQNKTLENSIIYVFNVETISKDVLSNIIASVGENSCVIFDGKVTEIEDGEFYADEDGSLFAILENFKDNSLFGAVLLKENYRGEFSNLSKFLI
jgi:PhoH-like ATPase